MSDGAVGRIVGAALAGRPEVSRRARNSAEFAALSSAAADVSPCVARRREADQVAIVERSETISSAIAPCGSRCSSQARVGPWERWAEPARCVRPRVYCKRRDCSQGRATDVDTLRASFSDGDSGRPTLARTRRRGRGGRCSTVRRRCALAVRLVCRTCCFAVRVPLTRSVPGSSSKMLKKSLESPADALCYDLEDSVAVQRKGEARSMVVDALNAAEPGRHERFVRVNSLPTGLTQDDLEAVVRVLRMSCGVFALVSLGAARFLVVVLTRLTTTALVRQTRRHRDPESALGRRHQDGHGPDRSTCAVTGAGQAATNHRLDRERARHHEPARGALA